MAPNLTEDEIDDLLYLARTGENDELSGDIARLAARESVTPAEILTAAKDESKATCLHMATGNGHLETVRLLLSHFTEPAARHAFLDAPNEFGNTGLHWAALGGHLETVRCLVEAGAAPALANQGDFVPLDLALSRGHQGVVDFFFERAKDKEGENGEKGALEGAVEGVELNGDEEGDEAAAAADEAGGSGGERTS
ncbi:hypothetical protein VUR80DRAFT_5963 [Thermomyces stellatus]